MNKLLIVTLLCALLLTTINAQRINCTQAQLRITNLAASCSVEVAALLAAGGTGVLTDAFFDIECSAGCKLAFEGYLQVSACPQMTDPASSAWIAVNPTLTAQMIKTLAMGLQSSCRIDRPDPSPGARCGVDEIGTLMNATRDIVRDCGLVDMTSTKEVCNGTCKQTREAIAQALRKCRHREGVIDRFQSPGTQLRLKAIDRACKLRERARETISECRAIPWAQIYAGIQAECGVPNESATVSLKCRVTVRASLKLFQRCAYVLRKTSNAGFFTEQVMNNLRRWKRAANVLTSRIEAEVDSNGDIVYSSTDDLRKLRSTTRSWIGVDVYNRLSFLNSRFNDSDDSTPAERFRLTLENLCEVRLNARNLTANANTTSFDWQADAGLVAACHNFTFPGTECTNLDLGTFYTGVSANQRQNVNSGVRNYSTDNPTRLFRTSCQFGPSGLSRVILNHAVLGEESESFGLRTRAGGSTAPWVFSDIPRTEPGIDNALAVCVLIDTEAGVNETEFEPTEVADGELDTTLTDDSVPTGERSAAEFRIGSRRFRFRRYAYCSSSGVEVRLRVRVRCHKVVSPTDIDSDLPQRHRCCFTFVRSVDDESKRCERLYFDPSVSATDDDTEAIPASQATTSADDNTTDDNTDDTGNTQQTSSTSSSSSSKTTEQSSAFSVFVPILFGAILILA